MKMFLGIIVVLGVLVSGFGFTDIASADLTKQDIEEIRKIVREEVQREVRRIDERIDGLDKRIDDLDSKLSTRINDLSNLLYVILAGMFALVGFVLWDRRSALAPAVREMRALEERENRLERILREYAQKEPELAAIMRSITL
ncbi:MAG: hypothetical protein AB1567_12015 [bacterium]